MTSPWLLEARELTFGYASDAPVLNRWSARFAPGEMTALTGPSGRGKSTLMYLLGLMLHPRSGDVIVDGSRSTTLRDRERSRLRASQFGFVFQDAALDPTRSVLDNIIEGSLYRGEDRREAEHRANSLMSQFGVHIPSNRRPGQVSGGQAQRIALCRALLHTPKIVLADEPTGNLDPATAELVIDSLRASAAQGATVIVVTHTADVAASCDREIVL